MLRSSQIDGFRLAYERAGSGPPVVLLHGWPGDHRDYREMVPRLSGVAEAVVPDLRGFGESDRHPEPPAEAYSAAAQARSVLALLDELGLEDPVLVGYDIGSRVAQTVARTAAHRVRALVISPPVPGAGERVLSAEAQREFWYQTFHRLELPERILDGRPDAVRAYLEHFWSHWSGPGFAVDEAELDRLAERYGRPGAFIASIGWYRARSAMVASSLAESPPAREERIAVPTTLLWPEHDPLFPPEWSDRIDHYFGRVKLERLPGSGHFTPLEAPDRLVAAVAAALTP
ncbi:MAG: alpha/beta hydrolase [Solirubrobacterales bacterium]|nr:alpha/beta hydrolase [Solirubrobacterales bacterium]MBV9714393.1 alpha/beta hydrolase [Solirubrobacterales bacterium]